jgi:hypothetical protein
MGVADVMQVATTVAETAIVLVAVAARADVDAMPSVRKPRATAWNEDFIEVESVKG